MTELFISYSRRDQDFVETLRSSLVAHKYSIWIDKEDIPHAAKWWREIQKGIDSSDAVIVVMTNNSLSSPICHAEFAYVLRQNKLVIPVLRENLIPQQFMEVLEKTTTDVSDEERLNGSTLIETGHSNWFEFV